MINCLYNNCVKLYRALITMLKSAQHPSLSRRAWLFDSSKQKSGRRGRLVLCLFRSGPLRPARQTIGNYRWEMCCVCLSCLRMTRYLRLFDFLAVLVYGTNIMMHLLQCLIFWQRQHFFRYRAWDAADNTLKLPLLVTRSIIKASMIIFIEID